MMTNLDRYIDRLVRDYGSDAAAMQRLIDRFASRNDEGWTFDECDQIAHALREEQAYRAVRITRERI